MKDYPYIRAYGLLLGSFPSYIDGEVEKAGRANAPQTAISRRQDGSWTTFEEIQFDDTRERIAALVAKMQEEQASEMPTQKCKDRMLSGVKKTTEDKIIIDRMDAEEFLAMLMDAAKQDNPTKYYNTTQIIENIASEFKTLCKL